MSEGALSRVQRLCIGNTGTTIYGTPVDFEQISGIEAVTLTVGRESLADNRQLTGRKGQFASHIGQKNFEMAFSVPLHNGVASQLDKLLECAIGSKVAASVLTVNAAGSTADQLDVTGGTADPLVRVQLSDGRFQVRPVDDTNRFIIRPDLGAATIADAANAATAGGACYKHAPQTDTIYLAAEVDRDVEPDQIPYVANGLVPSNLTVSIDLAQRLMLQCGLKGGEWLIEAGANLADPDPVVGQYLGFSAEAFVTPLDPSGDPQDGVQLDVSTMSINLAADFLPRLATRFGTSTGAVPGSPIAGFKRGLHFSTPIAITITKADDFWNEARTLKTPFSMLINFVQGQGDDVNNTQVISLWIPRMVLDADPTLTDIGGIEGQQLSFRVEDGLFAAPQDTQGVVAFFV